MSKQMGGPAEPYFKSHHGAGTISSNYYSPAEAATAAAARAEVAIEEQSARSFSKEDIQKIGDSIQKFLAETPLLQIAQALGEVRIDRSKELKNTNAEILENTQAALKQLPAILNDYFKLEPERFFDRTLRELPELLKQSTGVLKNLSSRTPEISALVNELELVEMLLPVSLDPQGRDRMDAIVRAAGDVSERLSDVRNQALEIKPLQK